MAHEIAVFNNMRMDSPYGTDPIIKVKVMSTPDNLAWVEGLIDYTDSTIHFLPNIAKTHQWVPINTFSNAKEAMAWAIKVYNEYNLNNITL